MEIEETQKQSSLFLLKELVQSGTFNQIQSLTDELKPWVDRSWRTLSEAKQTGVCGSSLGGLVSLYAGLERPDVFGRVASLSGSFWLRGYVDRIEARTIQRWPDRIWLDSGNQGNSADSLENTLHVRDVLLKKELDVNFELEI